MAAGPTSSAVLSASQLRTLAELGEERTAAAGEVLFALGDRTYPFIAILEGEAAVLDGAGEEIVRHGAGGFLGEMSLLSGQTVFLSAVAHRADALHRGRPRRPAAAAVRGQLARRPRAGRRSSAAARSSRSDRGSGSRSSARASPPRPGGSVEWARRARLPHTWRDPEHDPEAARALAGARPRSVPLVRLPGGPELHRPSNGELSRALGIGLELAPARGGRPGDRRRRPGRPRRRRLRRLGGPRHAGASRAPCSAARPGPRGGSRTTSASRPGSAAPS